MKKVLLKIKSLPHYSGPPLKYESDLASGFDIRAQLDGDITIAPGQRLLIPTGLSFEVAPNYELQVRPRSGLAIKKGVTLVNSPGTIDADYRGEIKVIIINHGNEIVTISPQDRIAQLVLCPVVQAEFQWVSHLGASKRGEAGFGSTGVK